MADEISNGSSNTIEDNVANVTSFSTATKYPDAVSVYNDARVNSTGDIVGGDLLTLSEKFKNFVKNNWLTMVVSFAVTYITVRFMNKTTSSSSVGGFSLWRK